MSRDIFCMRGVSHKLQFVSRTQVIGSHTKPPAHCMLSTVQLVSLPQRLQLFLRRDQIFSRRICLQFLLPLTNSHEY